MTTETSTSNTAATISPAQLLTRDLRNASKLLTPKEARYLVGVYYDLQEQRIRANSQVRATEEENEPNLFLQFTLSQYDLLENNAKNALGHFARSHDVGKWSMGITGIGPVIAAGLLAHIDITRCVCDEPVKGTTHICPGIPTVGHIWSYAGLDPRVEWKSGEKRPWNAKLKTLCWKIGESFVMSSGRESSFYGKVYKARKEYEEGKNAAGHYADQAATTLEKKNFSRDTTAKKFYEQGMLPPAHIHSRAKRYTVKFFLSHWHHVAYESTYNVVPPKPYAIDILHHGDYVAPPNWPLMKK